MPKAPTAFSPATTSSELLPSRSIACGSPLGLQERPQAARTAHPSRRPQRRQFRPAERAIHVESRRDRGSCRNSAAPNPSHGPPPRSLGPPYNRYSAAMRHLPSVIGAAAGSPESSPGVKQPTTAPAPTSAGIPTPVWRTTVPTGVGTSLLAGQQLGEVDDARSEPASLDALLELPVAARVDDRDDVEVCVGDLVEMAVEHARAVVGAHDRVGALLRRSRRRRSAARRTRRRARSARAARARRPARCGGDRSPAARSAGGRRAGSGSGVGASRSTSHCESSLTRSGPSTLARCAAHPPAVVTIVPGSASPSSSASSLPRSSAPLCACSAPQQPWSAGAAHSGTSSRAARLTRGYRTRSKHPSMRFTGPGASLRRPACRRTTPIARTRRGESTAHISGRTFQGRRRPFHRWSRHSSNSAPYWTPAGHTGSHARQPRQNDASSRTVGSSSANTPVSSARIRLMRPRGDDVSTPVSSYVGQAGRQKPQEMQRSSSSGVNTPRRSGTVSGVMSAVLMSRACRG